MKKISKYQKIGILINKITGGGAERFSVNLANGLVDNGYSVFLITSKKREKEYPLNQHVYRNESFSGSSILSDMFFLRNYLKQEHIDVLIAVDIYANLCAALSNFFLKTKIVICERNAPAQTNLRFITKLARKFLYWRGDAYVFQTTGAREFYSKSIQKRGYVIPNPVKPSLPLRTMKRKEVIAIGRLTKQKNYDVLINAFSEVCKVNNTYQLRIFGEGEEKQRLKDMVYMLQIQDNVCFEGYYADVHTEIREADIYVLSSDYEGLPNSLMEAMAMGFPVISTDCPAGGPKMLIKDGENGLLVSVNCTKELTKAILYMIGHQTEKENMALKARQVGQKYSEQEILKLWVKFLDEI